MSTRAKPRQQRSAAVAPLMTTAEAAAYLKFPEKTVKDWRRRDTGPAYIKVNGAQVRYRLADLDAWLDEQEVRAS